MTVHHGCRQIVKAVQAHIGRLYAHTTGTASLEADNDTGKAVANLYPLISTSAERKKKLKQISSWRCQHKQIELTCSQRKGHHKNLRNIGEAIVLLAMSKNTSCSQMLQFKELEMASERSFPADIFTASYSWWKGFIRIRLPIRTTPDDAEAAAASFELKCVK
ncbi:Hypothetical protein PHPALM_19221 [Phytophthora palmivora]|uniref:HTH CENPB-type domain-containing protein n=1 Tax=Phytophthora palmivora TaxID=4796 RepID=A0A2P4XHU3_9STRA|nr:Hypothetical protein PHPALM_19221 [Phytophthora palmivora]